MNFLLSAFRTLAQITTAGIAITAFSLLIYALTFNLRDRVARSFATIMLCVAIAFSGKAVAGAASTLMEAEVWLRVEWVGLVFLPAAYLHFSDALLATTGQPSRGRRRLLVRLSYLAGLAFFILLIPGWLVDPLVSSGPAPYLQRTPLTYIFLLFYLGGVIWAWVNLHRAYRRTRTPTSRRRMIYLAVGAIAPGLGSFPYLVFGSSLVVHHPLLFWTAATINNLVVTILLVIMAYAVAFFGVSWPDRLVRSRLLRWLLRGPVTASFALAVVTLIRRAGETWGLAYTSAVPIFMVVTVLIMEHLVTLFAPLWEQALFYGGDQNGLRQLQQLEERLLTRRDLNQFLETVLAAICDHLQVTDAFVAALGKAGPEWVLTIGNPKQLEQNDLPEDLAAVVRNGMKKKLFTWGDYWIVPLSPPESLNGDSSHLLGVLGVARHSNEPLDEEQYHALLNLAERAAMALADRKMQEEVFNAVEMLTPHVDLIQSIRAAARYNGRQVLTSPEDLPPPSDLTQWVKDALSHFWGGPKLTQSPLLRLEVVRQALAEHDNNPAHALRAILRRAIDQVRPEGERRFTTEWILYNILEMKFMEGRKVRDVALRLAMSEADLYRKQRVAIEAVANAIVEMERQARSTVDEQQG
jgi:truncated hemoglobin YjbI